MKASKDWGACGCNCGTPFKQGDEIVVHDGKIYRVGHQNKATRQMPVIHATPKSSKKENVQ